MEKALIKVSGGTLMESEVITNAVDFAQKGFAGNPITLPKNYDLTKAVKNFCFELPKVKDIEEATKESIFKATHEYISQGLDIGKKQCALIVRKNKKTEVKELHLQKEYFGNKKIAMDYNPNIAEISNGTCIYEGDKIELVPLPGGRLQVKHQQDFMNMFKALLGVYATVTYKDGTFDTEIMTINELKSSWAKGSNGDEVHKQFPAEMARKTVISRLCKKLVNSTNDKGLLDESEQEEIDAYETIEITNVKDYSEPGPVIADEINSPTIATLPSAMSEQTKTQTDSTAEDYVISVPYKKYKEDYPDCKTGHYDNKTRMIDVYPNRLKASKESKPIETVAVDDNDEDSIF